MISRPVVELGADGTTATARTDVVWIAANFENTILGRYEDELVRDDRGWRFRRRGRAAGAVHPRPAADVRRRQRRQRGDDARRRSRRAEPLRTNEGTVPEWPQMTTRSVIVDDPAFDQLIERDAELVKIGEGYQFSEGPVWNQREQALYFSDIPGDARWRWTADGGMQLAAAPTFKGNGLAFDVDGSLLVCEQVSSCLVRIHSDGRRELVAWHLDGVYLNSPNDVVVRALDGSIYFTDPDYGRWNDWIGCKRDFVRDVKGVYRVPPGGGAPELVVEPDEFEQPNGLCFSPTRASSTSTTRREPTSRRSTSTPTGRSAPAACSATRSARGRWPRATSTAWSVMRSATSGPRVRAACGCSTRRASGSAPSAPLRSAAASCSADPI